MKINVIKIQAVTNDSDDEYCAFDADCASHQCRAIGMDAAIGGLVRKHQNELNVTIFDMDEDFETHRRKDA